MGRKSGLDSNLTHRCLVFNREIFWGESRSLLPADADFGGHPGLFPWPVRHHGVSFSRGITGAVLRHEPRQLLCLAHGDACSFLYRLH